MSILSARSGESEDNFISDLSVGWKMTTQSWFFL